MALEDILWKHIVRYRRVNAQSKRIFEYSLHKNAPVDVQVLAQWQSLVTDLQELDQNLRFKWTQMVAVIKRVNHRVRMWTTRGSAKHVEREAMCLLAILAHANRGMRDNSPWLSDAGLPATPSSTPLPLRSSPTTPFTTEPASPAPCTTASAARALPSWVLKDLQSRGTLADANLVAPATCFVCQVFGGLSAMTGGGISQRIEHINKNRFGAMTNQTLNNRIK